MSEIKDDHSIEPAEPRYDDDYNDPQAAIVLVANDGLRLRVHAWSFSRHSTFIRDLLSVGSTGDLSTPITVDVAPAALRIFVTHLYSAPASPPLDISFETALELFPLCDRFQCDGLENKIVAFLKDKADCWPWKLFKLASRRHDEAMAKMALRGMKSGTTDVPDLTRLSTYHVEGLSQVYLLELTRCLCSCIEFPESDAWGSVSYDFDVSRHQGKQHSRRSKQTTAHETRQSPAEVSCWNEPEREQTADSDLIAVKRMYTLDGLLPAPVDVAPQFPIPTSPRPISLHRLPRSAQSDSASSFSPI
ncbi:hypothetical protein P7C73_g1175, partial [Tremellales sp. Uapishka_1]